MEGRGEWIIKYLGLPIVSIFVALIVKVANFTWMESILAGVMVAVGFIHPIMKFFFEEQKKKLDQHERVSSALEVSLSNKIDNSIMLLQSGVSGVVEREAKKFRDEYFNFGKAHKRVEELDDKNVDTKMSGIIEKSKWIRNTLIHMGADYGPGTPNGHNVKENYERFLKIL